MDVVVAVANHDHVITAVETEQLEHVRDDLLLGAAFLGQRRADDVLEAFGELKVLEDPHRGSLRLGGCDRQRQTGRGELVEHRDDAVVEGVLEQPDRSRSARDRS